MSIDSIWPVHSVKQRTPDTYLHPRTVIGCGQRIALFARKPSGSQRAETSMQNFILIDEALTLFTESYINR